MGEYVDKVTAKTASSASASRLVARSIQARRREIQARRREIQARRRSALHPGTHLGIEGELPRRRTAVTRSPGKHIIATSSRLHNIVGVSSGSSAGQARAARQTLDMRDKIPVNAADIEAGGGVGVGCDDVPPPPLATTAARSSSGCPFSAAGSVSGVISSNHVVSEADLDGYTSYVNTRLGMSSRLIDPTTTESRGHQELDDRYTHPQVTAYSLDQGESICEMLQRDASVSPDQMANILMALFRTGIESVSPLTEY